MNMSVILMNLTLKMSMNTDVMVSVPALFVPCIALDFIGGIDMCNFLALFNLHSHMKTTHKIIVHIKVPLVLQVHLCMLYSKFLATVITVNLTMFF